MKRHALSISALLVALVLPALAVSQESADSEEPASRPIFNGQNFEGWRHDDSHWRVEDGAITGVIPDGEVLRRNLFLFWEGEVHDFELELEFRVEGHPSANSGVQFRSQALPGGGAAGYQADLDGGATWMGRIYDEHGRALIGERGVTTVIDAKGKRRSTPFRPAAEYRDLVTRGEWYHYRVRAVGPRLETYVNGELACVVEDHEVANLDFSGRLALQLHSGPGPATIQFRNVRLKELGRTVPPVRRQVREGSREGIVPLGEDGKPLNLGFETGTFEDWKIEGELWKGQRPTHGDTVTPRRPGQSSQHDGEYWVGGYERTRKDDLQGVLESVPFEVTHPHASFLVGGGPHRETRVEIALADSGKVVHSASGRQLENLEPEVVDLKEHLGKKIVVRVVDESSGPWGHVNYDDFRFHEKLSGALERAGLPARMRATPLLAHLRKNPAKVNIETPGGSTVARTYLPEGFEADLIAAEPRVRQPIAFCFDERGRIWIVEAMSYPQRQPEGEGKDRIIILEDFDGDGSFETTRTFAEGLNLVSGLALGHGGVWVGAAPYLLFIPDANGDDVPDGEPRVLLDGWGYQDTHETLNSFVWGPDGWLYGNHGVFNFSLIGKPGTPERDREEFRAGVWRYHPRSHEFEIFARGGSNQWGLDFDERGEFFMTHCRSYWGRGSTTHVIRNGHFWNQANSRHAPFISGHHPEGLPHLRNFLLASARYGHGEGGAGAPGSRALYGGHSHVGTMIYLGDNWPAEYRNHLFSHNLHGHQINRQVNVRRGSGYETLHAGLDVAFVDDPRYVAVDLDYGPDGSVYVIDWVDRQHCHSPHMERWDRSNGRVYRIRHAESFEPRRVNLARQGDLELLALLDHPNAWYGRVATRLLGERAARGELSADVPAKLRGRLSNDSELPTLRALWALKQTDSLEDADLLRLLDHPAESVRAWAVRLATDPAPEAEGLWPRLVKQASTDPSGRVRLALASALPEANAEIAWQLTGALASRPGDAGDRFLPPLVWSGIAPHTREHPDRAFELAGSTAWPELRDWIHWYASKTPEGLGRLVGMLGESKTDDLRRLLRILAFGLGPRGNAMPAGWPEVASALYRHEDGVVRERAEVLGARFAHEPILRKQREILVAAGSSKGDRRRAFDILSAAGDAQSLSGFLALLDEEEYRSKVISLLGRHDDPRVAGALLSRLGSFSQQDRFRAIDALTSRRSLASALLEAVEKESVPRSYLSSLHLRKMRGLGDADLEKKISSMWGEVRQSPAEIREKVASLTRQYREAPLWAYDARVGRKLFEEHCLSCHAVNGQGGRLGPDLAGSGRNGPAYFLENILDPGAVVGEDYQSTRVLTRSGEVLAGLVADPGADPVIVRTATGERQVKRDEILNLQKQEESFMPSGLLEPLSQRQIIELLKYLDSLR